MTAKAPIVMFVYNRPRHTLLSVEALQQNELAKESDLIIYSDASKSESQADAVREVRQYISQIDGFRSVTIVEREINFGLARSIIDGVTSVVNKYGRIIVLEDDIVTSPHFLTFMNDALGAYRDEEKVMHISGYMFPIDTSGLPETFFLRTASCWGWATWDRAWRHFRKDPLRVISEYSEQEIYRFNMDGACGFWSQVLKNANGLINTWAVFWYASVFEEDGLCLHPAVSMVDNIGNDDTGMHCGKSSVFCTNLADNQITFFEKNIFESVVALLRTEEFLRGIKPSFLRRIFSAIKRRLILLSSGCVRSNL